MPVDKFGRMSDTKTRDTGVSLTYINNNYIRSDGNTPVSGSINMNGNTLYNASDPVNPQDVATKEYTDYIKFILHKNIASLTQLYITLYRTQEEINKTQQEINKRFDKTQEDINERITIIAQDFSLDYVRILSKYKTRIITTYVNYQGRSESGKYLFNFLNKKEMDNNIGCLMPCSGRVISFKIDTPFNFKKLDHSYNIHNYETINLPFLSIVKKKKKKKNHRRRR